MAAARAKAKPMALSLRPTEALAQKKPLALSLLRGPVAASRARKTMGSPVWRGRGEAALGCLEPRRGLETERIASRKAGARPKRKELADGRWCDSCPVPSANGLGGNARDPSSSTDPFIIHDEGQEEMAERVKKNNNDNIVFLRESLRHGIFSPTGKQVICAELLRQGFLGPGFEPPTAVKEEEDDEYYGRPPYY